MQNDNSNMKNVSWENLMLKTTKDDVKNLVMGMDMVVFENWSKLPKYNSLFTNFGEILSDPSKKN